jgi:hypothetical protein
LSVEDRFNNDILVAHISTVFGDGPTDLKPHSVLTDAVLEVLSVEIEGVSLELQSAKADDPYQFAVILIRVGDQLHE